MTSNKIITSILCLILIGITAGLIVGEKAKTDMVTEIADRLGVERSWEAIFDYLTISFRPGMTKDEVHSILDKVGLWTVVYYDQPNSTGIWDPETNQVVFREIIEFENKTVRSKLANWDFHYDVNDLFVSWSLVHSG